MTNLEKITQIDSMADLIFNTGAYDYGYCPSDNVCEKDTDVEKEDCVACIKGWLMEEEK